jgi:hypothetical protein
MHVFLETERLSLAAMVAIHLRQHGQPLSEPWVAIQTTHYSWNPGQTTNPLWDSFSRPKFGKVPASGGYVLCTLGAIYSECMQL